MASLLPRLRFVCGSVYPWRSPFVLSRSDSAALAPYNIAANAKSTGVARFAVNLATHAFKSRESCAFESATGSVVRSVSTASAGRPASWEHTPQNTSQFSRSFGACVSPCAATTPSTGVGPSFPSFASIYRSSSSSAVLLGSSGFSARGMTYFMSAEQTGSVSHHQQRDYHGKEGKYQLPGENRQELHAQQRRLQLYQNRNGRQRQNRQRQQQHEGEDQQGRNTRVPAMLAVSPLLFTQWDDTSSPKNELIFVAGNTLGYCTEKFFENEYGQSIFAFVLGLVYLALLGYEGKVNGAVWRLKHVFGSNMSIVGHPRYAYALPRNPLLSSSQKNLPQRNTF